MVIAVGKVVDGQVVVEGERLAEGEVVGVLIHDREPETFELSPQDEAELISRIKGANSGAVVDGDDHLRDLRAMS